MRIEEEFGETVRPKVAIEVKSGTDSSNAHNRAGEAEKSHLKAKDHGFRELWTVIATKGLDQTKLKAGSHDERGFNVAEVLGRRGPDWAEFESRVADVVGIPILGLWPEAPQSGSAPLGPTMRS